MAAAARGSWWGHLRTLLVLAIMGGILYEVHRRELEQLRQEQQAKQAEQTVREAVLARGDFGEMLRLCREGWNSIGLWDEPVAMPGRGGGSTRTSAGARHDLLAPGRCDGRA